MGTAADDSQRMCKVLENKSLSDESRMESLENQLKDARILADEADKKYDEIAKKLQMVESDLDRAEERADTGETKIIELEEKLRVVGNNLKSLEVSEEKANQREEHYKEQIKHLAATIKTAQSACEVPVIMFLMKSLWPGASMMVTKYLSVMNFHRAISMVIPRSRSAFNLSSTQAYLKEPLPISWASFSNLAMVRSSIPPHW